MKLFRFLTTTAITTMAVAAMAVSASAMTAEYSYDADNKIGTVALKDVPAATDGNQVTMLVLTSDALEQVGNTKTWVIKDTNIKQIDQDDSISSAVVGDLAAEIDATNKAIAEAALEDGKVEAAELANWIEDQTYYVRVGVNGGIETTTFVVPTTVDKPTVGGGEPTPSPIEGLDKGDADGDYWVGSADAAAVLKYEAGLSSALDQYWSDTEMDAYIIELVDSTDGVGDYWVGSDDAAAILKFEAGLKSDLDAFYDFN